MVTISILANTVRPSVNRRSDDTAFGAGTFSLQDPVHSWRAGSSEVMTVENLSNEDFLTLQDEFQLMTFGVGLCLLTVGVAMMIIVNVLKKCEHDAIITHLETQVDNAKRFRDSNRLLGGNKAVPEDKQILVQASNLV